MEEEQRRRLQLGRRMAYLKRCVIIIDLLKKHENDTSVRKLIFEKHIKPVVGMSYASFNRMLNERNPSLQIQKIKEELDKMNIEN